MNDSDEDNIYYWKDECISELPRALFDKYIGNSKYYFETFEDK